VDALDGSEEFINAHGFAGYIVSGKARVYGVAKLSGTTDALGSQ
jgi:hypothetical protein